MTTFKQISSCYTQPHPSHNISGAYLAAEMIRRQEDQRAKTERNMTMRINYVLIDFENVQPESLAVLQQDHFIAVIYSQSNLGLPTLSFSIC